MATTVGTVNITDVGQEIVDTVNVVEENVTVSLGTTGLRGRPGAVWRGEWSGTSNYYVGDLVKRDGNVFICTAYIDASTTAYPGVTSNWEIFAEKGEDGERSVLISADAPTGHCSIDGNTTQSACISAGGTWSALVEGDLWYETDTEGLFTWVNNSWYDISSQKTIMANEVSVEADGELPQGNLQDILKRLEDAIFTTATTPTGSNVQDGTIWYDTVNQQLKVRRNGTWVTIAQSEAMNDGYDDLTMNGGYF